MHAGAAGGSAAAVEQDAAEEAAASQLQKWWKDCIARKSAAAAKSPNLQTLQGSCRRTLPQTMLQSTLPCGLVCKMRRITPGVVCSQT